MNIVTFRCSTNLAVAMTIQSRQKFRVKNRLGIHAAPAAMIAKILNKYQSIDVWVRNVEEQVNGKSIMSLMMLEARRNTDLLFIVEGGTLSEHQNLLKEIAALFDSKFYED